MKSTLRSAVPVLLCLILILGGLCSVLCLAQNSSGDSPHSCCHEKNHCGHAAQSMQSHQAVAGFDAAPMVMTQPLLLTSAQFPVGHRVNAEVAISVAPIPLPPLVLRL